MQEERNEKPFNQQEEELTRTVREGVKRPEGFAERLKLAGDKLTGKVPLGADASSKTTRKTLASSGALLGVVRFGFCGLILVLLGPLFLWAGLSGGIHGQSLVAGLVLLPVGVWCLKIAASCWRDLKAIRRA